MATLSRRELHNVKTLYYRQKLSAPEIARVLKVPLNAVYYFMRRHHLVRRNLSEQNRVRFDKKPESFKVRSPLNFRDKELKILGVMLYWAEGFKSPNAVGVDFANSNPDMISLFLKFLRRICGINESKLRVYLYCYSDQNVKSIIHFWSTLTSIPKQQFTKPYVRSDFKKEKSGKMKYGLIHVRYHDKKLLNLINLWIADYVKKFAQVVP